MDNYFLEKWIWTEADFDCMGWHDATVYAFRFNGDLSLDIDYIFKWNQPDSEFSSFTFFVAPCTLTFKEIRALSLEFSLPAYGDYMEIADINLEIKDGIQHYTVNTQQGQISFFASGYTQTVRMHPSFQLGQVLDYDERGGISFETTIDNKLTPDVADRVKERKAKEYERYMWSKERHMLIGQIDALQRQRDANAVSLKDFLKEKRRLKEKLAYYDNLLGC